MSKEISLAEAQERLSELVKALKKGEELRIVEDNELVARIIGERFEKKERPGPGLGKGMITIISDDDDHLEHFKEYMP